MTIPSLAEIRGRVRRYQSNPDSVDASADMAACCDTDLTVLLEQHEALLNALDALIVNWRQIADSLRDEYGAELSQDAPYRVCALHLVNVLENHRQPR